MKQLSPIDSIFVYNEQPYAPLHISPVMLYDPTTAPGGFVRFKDILGTFKSRLHRSPVFRRRLVKVPLNLDHPYWVEDSAFDLEFHVRHIALPKPGDWRQFCIQVARLHSRPLDLTRPPWEAYIIEGLDNVQNLPRGSFAMYLKIHHSAIDGATGNQIVEALHDLTPRPVADKTADTWRGEAIPSPFVLLGKAYVNALRQPRNIVELIKQTVPTRSMERTVAPTQSSHAVKGKTRFNANISPHRVFGGVPFSLTRVKDIKNVIGECTLNDVVLCIVSGALRKYLQAKNELPESPLIAGVPISTRTRTQSDARGGNAVAGMRINLRTDVDDPVERLRLINADAVASKAYANAVGAKRMVAVAESFPSSVAALGMRIAVAMQLGSRIPIVHSIVTNVPGPQVPLYMCGARAVSWFGAGCPMDGMGLFHTINSYCGQIVVAYLACRQMMPDPEFYDQCIRESFDELEEAALAARARVVTPRGKGRSRSSPATPKRRAPKPAAGGSVPPRRAKSHMPMS
jgi:diacylglycerol O-acyltransferase / wax synthase